MNRKLRYGLLSLLEGEYPVERSKEAAAVLGREAQNRAGAVKGGEDAPQFLPERTDTGGRKPATSRSLGGPDSLKSAGKGRGKWPCRARIEAPGGRNEREKAECRKKKRL